MGPRKGGLAPQQTGGFPKKLWIPQCCPGLSSLSNSGQSEHPFPHPYDENAISSQDCHTGSNEITAGGMDAFSNLDSVAPAAPRGGVAPAATRRGQDSSTLGPESIGWGCQGERGWAATGPYEGANMQLKLKPLTTTAPTSKTYPAMVQCRPEPWASQALLPTQLQHPARGHQALAGKHRPVHPVTTPAQALVTCRRDHSPDSTPSTGRPAVDPSLGPCHSPS